jgi:hypothetical protein
MECNNRLVNAALDYAEESERLRGSYEKMNPDYLKGRIDQYDEGVLPNIPLVGRFFQPREIRLMRFVLEEKSKIDSE